MRRYLTAANSNYSTPGESEDFGPDWQSPAALVEFGERVPTEPWVWDGRERAIEGQTWGGCFEVLDQIAVAGRIPSLDDLRGTILLLESSEESPPATLIKRWLRALGERGVLGVIDGVLVARPPVSSHESLPDPDARGRLRGDQRDAVICIGVPFCHTRPQWILPYGGRVRIDGRNKTVIANFD